MRIEILKHEGNELEIKFKNATVTIPSFLVALLQKDKDVEFAAFKIIHPSSDDILLYVKTKSKDPKKVLEEKINEGINLFKTFKLQVEKGKF